MSEIITKEMEVIKKDIIKVVNERDNLKKEIAIAKNINKKLSSLKKLQQVDLKLSKLDTKYKLLWDKKNLN